MPTFRITAPDGTKFEIEGPEGATPEDAIRLMTEQARGDTGMPGGPAPAATAGQPKGRAAEGGVVGGVIQGATDPIHGGAQLLTHLLPEPVVQAGNRLNNWLADQGVPLARIPAGGLDQMVRDREAQYQADREAAGRGGADVARLAGGMAAPTGLAGGAILRGVGGASAGRMAAAGGVAGAAGGLAAPVTDTSPTGAGYATQKAVDVAAGGVAGAALGPVVGKAAQYVGDALAKGMRTVARPDAATVAAQADAAIAEATERLRAEGAADIPAAVVENLRGQVATAFREGRQPDIAALMRQADFDRFGIQPTAGQVTRDPAQWSREQNLRGVENAGEPLRARMREQQTSLRRAAGRIGAPGTGPGGATVPDRPSAGSAMAQALVDADKPRRQAVTTAYDTARDLAGNDARVGRDGIAAKWSEIVDEYGDAVPGALKSRMQGILNDADGNEVAPTIRDVERAIKTANRNDNPADRARSNAIRETKQALEQALDDLGDAGDAIGKEAADAYKSARGLARERFQRIERNPMLAAALDGNDPERFVDRFVIRGTARELEAMAKDTPEVVDSARQQILEHLRGAGWRNDTAGDAGFGQAAFNRELSRIGDQKLALLFTADEIADLKALGRVGAFISQEPATATVSRSNSNVPLMNLLTAGGRGILNLPGVNIATQSVQRYGQGRDVAAALTPKMKSAIEGMPDEARARMLQILIGQSAGAAGGSTARVND